MPRLVDGDNVLGSWPGRSRSDAEKRQLARECDRLRRRERRRVLLVFDGIAPPGVAWGADVTFSGAGRRADAVILERLRQERDPRGWTVVTNDRSLADQCRWVGARVEGTKPFRERLSEEDGAEKPERDPDLDYWLETFGDDEA